MRFLVAAAGALGFACAQTPVARPPPIQKTTATVDRSAARGRRIARIATAHVETRRRLRRRDCSGFVETVLASVGTDVRASTKTFYAAAKRDGRWAGRRPRVGDLAFFDYSYDANKNRRRDDRLSHIAIVTRVFGDGRVRLVHHGASGVRAIVLSLTSPHRHRRDGVLLNDYLAHKSYAGRRSRLTGALLRGFARPPPRDPSDMIASLRAQSRSARDIAL